MFAVKVGDEVGYFTSGTSGFSSGLRNPGFATVTKINGHGHIMLDTGVVFNKFGKERGDKWSYKMLIEAARLREIVASENTVRNRNYSARAAKDGIEQIFANARNGYGDSFITAENKAEMIALINAIEEYK
jgi:hypothetical protein